MATTKHPKATAPESPEIVQSDNYVSIYSNNVQLQMSLFDVRLIFGEGSSIGEIQHIEQKVAVVMSLHHAKAFAQILSDNLNKYEQEIGELKLPHKTAPAPVKAQ